MENIQSKLKTMIFWLFCAFIWFKNIEKMLLQMTSGFLQLESTIGSNFFLTLLCLRSTRYLHNMGDQEGLFKLVMLNFIFKWYNWSNFRLLTASPQERVHKIWAKVIRVWGISRDCSVTPAL
jgi:hypothetical protein